MGTNDISTAKANGNLVDLAWYNDFRSALKGDFVGRDGSSGAVASGQNLGTPVYPWGAAYVTSLVVGGSTIDFTALSGDANAIISGAVRSTSAQPDFLRPDGAAAEVDILGATTSLVMNIDGTATTVSSNLTETGLTVAPSSNNTATINDGSLSDQESSKWQGEDGTTITISSAGSEITSRVGQYAVFKKDTEYFLAYIKSSTELTNCYRGFFFDSSGTPIDRVTLANSDSISIMSGGWVFIEDDATTIDVTYKSPIYSMTEPGSPATGDYWFDLDNNKWKRYSGSAFAEVNRIPLGIAVIDTSNCVAARSFDFNKTYEAPNPLLLQYVDATTVQANAFDFDLSVYGFTPQTRSTLVEWDITTDLESGVSEGASTTYYAYVTEEGDTVLSDIKPYDLRGTLKGYYHPYNSWRAIGYIQNDGSSNFDSDTLYNYANNSLEIIELGKNNLKAFEDFTSAADKLFYYNGANSGALTDFTSFARTLLDDSSASAMRSTLGLGDIATLNQSDFRSTGTSGSFSGSGTATLTATIPTGYTKVICFLENVQAASGTGTPAMTFAVSYDSGSTWSAEFSLGNEAGNTGAFGCQGAIEIGSKASTAGQSILYYTYSSGSSGTNGLNWTGVAPSVAGHGNGNASAINRVRLTVTSLTGGMSSGTIRYLAIK